MSSSIDRLLSVAGPARWSSDPVYPSVIPGRGGVELAGLLMQRNGFYAFESALYVRPYVPDGSVMDVLKWNDQNLWRSRYGHLADNLTFFAEDIFGAQFALGDSGVVSFDPETGDITEISKDLNGWATALLDDFDSFTGYAIGHLWQQLNGGLKPGYRLLPKRPFVLGGEFDIPNLYLCDEVEGMRLRGDLASQLLGLPEGASVSFKIVD